MGWQQDGAHGAAHSHRIGASRPAGHHARRVGAWLSRRLFCPLAASPASPVIDHRRPTRCIAMRCRPHRERAHLPTGSSWIVAALAPSSVVRTARPVTPTVKLVAVTARGEQEPRPGRLDAAGARGRTPGRPGCRPGAQGPRRSGGRAPARAYPSSEAPAGGRAPERGCDCPARPPPAITLSDAGGQGECARSRLYMLVGWSFTPSLYGGCGSG